MRLEYTALGVSTYWFGATYLLKSISIDAAFLSAGAIFIVLLAGKLVLQELGHESAEQEAITDD